MESVEGVTVIIIPDWFIWVVITWFIIDVATSIWKRVLKGKYIKEIARLKEISDEYDRREKENKG